MSPEDNTGMVQVFWPEKEQRKKREGGNHEAESQATTTENDKKSKKQCKEYKKYKLCKWKIIIGQDYYTSWIE